MAMTIFLILNGLGVIFLLYALAHFWEEGHRRTYAGRKYAAHDGQQDWTHAFVVTHAISHSAQGGMSVIPFPARERGADRKRSVRSASRGASALPARRISTR
jgi:hypothetical protein